MSLVEGGPFRCYNHEKVFETTSLEEFNDHLVNSEELHTQSGSAPCALCGKGVQYENEPAVAQGTVRYILCGKCQAKQEKAQALRKAKLDAIKADVENQSKSKTKEKEKGNISK
jgi:hypothetical protein